MPPENAVEHLSQSMNTGFGTFDNRGFGNMKYKNSQRNTSFIKIKNNTANKENSQRETKLENKSEVGSKHQIYTEKQVLMIIKAVIQELAKILNDSNTFEQSDFTAINNLNTHNFNSLLALLLQPKDQFDMNSLNDVLKSHKLVTTVSDILTTKKNTDSALGAKPRKTSLFDWIDISSKADNKDKLLGKNSQSELFKAPRDKFKFSKTDGGPIYGLLNLCQSLNSETHQKSFKNLVHR